MTKAPVKSQTKIVNSAKRVREQLLRWEWDANTNNITAGTSVELYELNGSPGDKHDVRIGECEEVLEVGIEPAFDSIATPAANYIDEMRLFDKDGSQWNRFLTIHPFTRMNANQLPFNSAKNFENEMMTWGYKSFLNSAKSLAPTWKLPEGDEQRIEITANGAGNITDGYNRTFGVNRRYLPGSDVDYKHFNQYDGGLKSNKTYYNDVQYLATTVTNQWTQSWNLALNRNEGYKFFQGGVLPDVDRSAADLTSHLVESKLMIDDPQWEYNKYFVNHNYNNLPFVNSSSIYSDGSIATAWVHDVERMHRFTPTVDVLKNRNKSLTMYLQDDGVAATDTYTHMTGVKYQI